MQRRSASIALMLGALHSAAAMLAGPPPPGVSQIADAAPSVRAAMRPQKTFSPTLGGDIAYQLYLPPGYDHTGRIRYPVIYLLHGRGDNMAAWTTILPELDRMIVAGRIPALIAIMPDAPANRRAGYYIDSQFTGTADVSRGEPVETAFTTDLIAHVDGAFPTRPERSARVVAGYSMGGFGALRFALAHTKLFGAAIVLSPAVYVPLPPRDSSMREFGAFGRGAERFDDAIYVAKNYPTTLPTFAAVGLPLTLFIAVGDDEVAHADSREAAHDLDYEAHTLYNRVRRVRGITAQFRVLDGGHDWNTWRPAFVEGVDYVFKLLPAAATSTRAEDKASR